MRDTVCRLLPLAVVVGCAAHSDTGPQPLGLGLPVERVTGRAEWLDIQFAPLAYRHIGTDPQVGPWKILFSEQHHYCPVADSTYVIVQDGTLFPCQWRVVRP
jgi:hypothetical protein